jgi:glutaredoxin 3
MSEVVIYTKKGCPYCAAAKKHYNDKGIAFEEIDVFAVPGAKDKVGELSGGSNIVPIIIDKGEVTVGFGGG